MFVCMCLLKIFRWKNAAIWWIFFTNVFYWFDFCGWMRTLSLISWDYASKTWQKKCVKSKHFQMFEKTSENKYFTTCLRIFFLCLSFIYSNNSNNCRLITSQLICMFARMIAYKSRIPTDKLSSLPCNLNRLLTQQDFFIYMCVCVCPFVK